MKTTKYLLMGLAALAMTACNKNDEPVANEGNDATMSVRVQLNSGMRATVAEPKANESDVSSIAVFVFEKNGALVAKEQENGTEIKNIELKTGEGRTVYVVANMGATEYGKVTSEGKLKEQEADYIATAKNVTDGTQKLILSGKIVDVSIQAGHNYIGYGAKSAANEHAIQEEPLEIKRINARFEFEKLDPTFNADYKDYKLKFDANSKVFMNLVRTNSFLVGDDLAATPTKNYGFGFHPLSASTVPASGNWIDGLAVGTTYKEVADLCEIYKDENKGAYFYGFENNEGKKHPTMLVIRAKLVKAADDADLDGTLLSNAKKAGWIDAEGYTYYPIRINHYNEAEGYKGDSSMDDNIKRNTVYNLGTIRITKPGTNDPNNKIVSAQLDVTCTVADWAIVNQEVTW